jgi:hypothetical protein
MVDWGEAFLKALEGPEPLYSREEASRLLRMIGHAATAGRPVAGPEEAFCLTWAYTTLGRATGAPLPGDKLKALGNTVPLSVRTPPHFRMEKGKAVPVSPRFADRMKAVAQFESGLFVGPFKALLPPR